MPVTAKLSRKFYERFGDDIANELVDWFNAVDATYQGQLREVNDLNWARVQTRFTAFDERLDGFDKRLDGMAAMFDAKLDAMTARVDRKLDAAVFEAKVGAMEAKFDAKLDALESRLDTKVQRLRSELVLWMFGFWTATVIPLIGLMLVLSGTFRS